MMTGKKNMLDGRNLFFFIFFFNFRLRQKKKKLPIAV